MNLSQLSQSKLDHQLETFITNGKLPQAQVVLAPAGYTVAALEAAEERLSAWRAGQAQTRELMLAQKRITEAEQQARRAAWERYSQFKHTVRALFEEDAAVLRVLGLHPPARPNANGHGQELEQTDGSQAEPTGSVPARTSHSLAADIHRWRSSWANALTLEADAQARLADKGWTVDRLRESAAMVETVAQLAGKQQEAMHACDNQRQATKVIELELRRWFKEGRVLVRIAAQQADGQREGQIRKLLGV